MDEKKLWPEWMYYAKNASIIDLKDQNDATHYLFIFFFFESQNKKLCAIQLSFS